MKQAAFVAYCDLEIGDKVQIVPHEAEWTVYDILTTYSVRSNKVEHKFVIQRDGFLARVSRQEIKYIKNV